MSRLIVGRGHVSGIVPTAAQLCSFQLPRLPCWAPGLTPNMQTNNDTSNCSVFVLHLCGRHCRYKRYCHECNVALLQSLRLCA